MLSLYAANLHGVKDPLPASTAGSSCGVNLKGDLAGEQVKVVHVRDDNFPLNGETSAAKLIGEKTENAASNSVADLSSSLRSK
eukprot:SAG31_NODE_25514_length_459_cov_12.833333_1_plen_82_part_01